MQVEQEYFDKSGDSFIVNNNFIRNEHGFVTYAIHEDTLTIINVYGDGEYWSEWFENLARENGCKKMSFQTRRNPAAWKKKYDYNCVGYILEKEVNYG